MPTPAPSQSINLMARQPNMHNVMIYQFKNNCYDIASTRSQISNKALIEEKNGESRYLIQIYDHNKSQKAHLKDILYFVIDNFGTQSDETIEREKLKYQHNPELLAVFEVLVEKYGSLMKSKQEMIKYIFVKALKQMKRKRKAYPRTAASRDLLTSAGWKFKAFIEELAKDVKESERTPKKAVETVIEIMNKALANEEFCEKFKDYLCTFEENLKMDSNRKTARLIKLIEELLPKKSLKKINNYNKVPWLKVWIDEIRIVVNELINLESQSREAKRMKKEELSDSDQETQTNYSSKDIKTEESCI